jgi:maleamate amidohydrolase
MSSKFQHDEELLESRGFGLTLGFGRKPALVVIDLFYAFTDPLFDLGSDLDSVIAATNLLLDASHAANVPVIFTRVVYEEHDLADGGIWVRKQRGCLALWPGTRAAELDGRLHRAARDAVLFKKFASCFFGTSLVSRLVQHGIDTLVMSGCSTSGCVRATAVDACQYGFRPIVVRDAVGDRSASAHNQSLVDINSRYRYVVGIDQTILYLQSLPGEGP